MKDIVIQFPNGYQVIIWQEENNGSRSSFIGIVNQNGYVTTDRKLTVSEADKVNSLTNNP